MSPIAWTSPRTWVAGEVVSAALMNTHVRDNLLELNGTASAWTAYTPTVSNITVGNGVLVGAYKQRGKSVEFRIAFTLGSTSAVGTDPNFSPPVTSVATTQVAACVLSDASANTYAAAAYILAGTGVVPKSATGGISASLPFVWTTNDQIQITGVYEAA